MTLEELIAEIDTELERPLKVRLPSKLLYHYTDAFGLEGILRNGHVRATHFMYLNDRRELLEGRQIVHRAAEELEAAGANAVQRALSKRFREVFELPKVNEVVRDTFVSSFSEKGDDLGQWRAYGAHGGGYAIGIQFVEKPDHVSHDDLAISAMLVPCEYEHGDAKERIKAELIEVFGAVQRLAPQLVGNDDALRRFEAHGMVHALRRVAEHWLRIKNGHFHDEAEWRYVAGVSKGKRREAVKVRASARGLVPYVEIPLDAGKPPPVEVERIVVGPTLHPKEGVLAVVLLLESLGYDRAKAESIVVASEIPFRG
jgi:hypothetical protein